MSVEPMEEGLEAGPSRLSRGPRALAEDVIFSDGELLERAAVLIAGAGEADLAVLVREWRGLSGAQRSCIRPAVDAAIALARAGQRDRLDAARDELRALLGEEDGA